jgi:hypothetical protein
MQAKPNTGSVRTPHILCAALLTCAATFTMLAWGCGKEPPATSPPPPTVTNGAEVPDHDSPLPPPDHALIVLRNLEGWWEDCGCSGTAVGGVQRMPAAAFSARDTQFAMIGRTFLPGDRALSQVEQATVTPFFIELGRSIVERMGAFHWMPDALEQEHVAPRLGMPFFNEQEGATMKLGEVSIAMSAGRMSIDGLDFTTSFASLSDRGREVLVVAVWDNGGGPATYDRKLSALAPLSTASEAAAREAREVLSNHTGTVVAVWRRMITAELEVDPRLTETGQGRVLALRHMSGTSNALVAIDSGPDEETRARQWEACGRCHEAAWNKWIESPHAKAMTTLQGRLREHDPRCLPCHTTKVETVTGSSRAAPGHGAVTCASCHTNDGRPPASVCADCHTPHTDPEKHYLKALQSICTTPAGGKAAVACPER